MRDDFHVISHGPSDGPWDIARMREQYIRGSFNGVNLRFYISPPFKRLDFLLDFPGLQYVEVTGRINADTSVFELPDLRELCLLTKSSRAIPGFASPALTFLGLDDRPGKEAIASLGELKELAIWRWRGTDLRFFGAGLPLEVIRIEGMRQLSSLDGIETCRSLSTLEIRGTRVESLRPLADLTNIRRLRLWSGNAKGDARLDLSDLSTSENLEEINLVRAGSVQSLRPLLGFPRLREVRLGEINIIDGNLDPLNELPAGAVIVGPND